MASHVALLRGINVGGKNKLPMRDLTSIFTQAGCQNVQTYIQSGNVLFDAPDRVVDSLAGVVAAGIERQFGYATPVVIRNAGQVAKVVADNPFLRSGIEDDTLHVIILADAPEQRLIERLDPERSPGDAFVVSGQEIYVHLPNGVARSKLTVTYFDAKLATIGTQRNWRTMTKLVELMDR